MKNSLNTSQHSSELLLQSIGQINFFSLGPSVRAQFTETSFNVNRETAELGFEDRRLSG
jgi:hypothetical protein